MILFVTIIPFILFITTIKISRELLFLGNLSNHSACQYYLLSKTIWYRKKEKESRLQETSISMLDYNCIHIVPMLTKDIHEISLTRETFMGRRD